jgi:hypothetical protein
MKVQDLIAELSYLPADAEVHFQYSSGDYWRTQVAPKVSSVDLGMVEYSGYHRMCKVVEDPDDTKSVCKSVVLIG